VRIAVAGGTGIVGKYVINAAERAGHQATSLSRATGIDLRTGVGLQAALEGVDVIVDATNENRLSAARATAFFTAVTRRLQDAGSAAGAGRLITLSIVNIDRVSSYGYYKAKLAQEAAALEGPLPVTIVRATQFHEFPAQIMQRAHAGPAYFVPHMRVQTVAARSVGEVVIEMAVDPPERTTVDVAGPAAADLVDLARAVIRRRGISGKVIAIPFPGRAGQAMRSGSLTPSTGALIVGPSFDEWLPGPDIEAVAL
jgi:uncharacterized protein YbjT (DUF2867 family)